MTYKETAATMRKLADIIDNAVEQAGDSVITNKNPVLSEDMAVGAAWMICYLRDLIQGSPRQNFDQASLLVMLKVISEDSELFPCGVGKLMWDVELDAGEKGG